MSPITTALWVGLVSVLWVGLVAAVWALVSGHEGYPSERSCVVTKE